MEKSILAITLHWILLAFAYEMTGGLGWWVFLLSMIGAAFGAALVVQFIEFGIYKIADYLGQEK